MQKKSTLLACNYMYSAMHYDLKVSLDSKRINIGRKQYIIFFPEQSHVNTLLPLNFFIALVFFLVLVQTENSLCSVTDVGLVVTGGSDCWYHLSCVQIRLPKPEWWRFHLICSAFLIIFLCLRLCLGSTHLSETCKATDYVDIGPLGGCWFFTLLFVNL